MRKSGFWQRACALFAMWVATAIALPAQTFSVIHNFDGTDGSGAGSGLIQATDGYLYGTATDGGANNLGTVFKMTLAGTVTTIYSFSGPDGSNPEASLVQGTDGNFYGTTLNGGTNTACGSVGCGTVFQITPDGVLTTLHSFGLTDGQNPAVAALIQATDGDFYGTTLNGGRTAGGACSCGTVFKVSSSGTFTLLHNFQSVYRGTADGGQPYSGVIQASDGNFYGVTYTGGAYGVGVIYKMNSAGTTKTIFSFVDGPIGYYPLGGLVQGPNGNLYGSTTRGPDGYGCYSEDFNYGCGVIFESTLSGLVSPVHTFDQTDGGQMLGPMIVGSNGNFYGVTSVGGTSTSCTFGCGTLFEMTPTGTFTSLYSFCADTGCPDGDYEVGPLAQDTNGVFYGLAVLGGTSNDGTAYKLTNGLRPFLRMIPASGAVGASVNILGNNLSSATGVTFNGTPATFTIASGSLITATVPADATNGTVTVTLPTGELKSSVKFHVLP